MKRFYLLLLLFTAISLSTSAQIGYQVSLLNNSTGEPRANERVTVTVKITDSEGKTVCEETKNENSNDFGVVSMSIGDSETFANADWSKLPFFIEASVDGRMLGKSQLLSVPVAEYAKRTGTLTKEILCSKEWTYIRNDGYEKYNFNQSGNYTCIYKNEYESSPGKVEGPYFLDGNDVIFYGIDEGHEFCRILKYVHEITALIASDGTIWR